MTQNHTLRTLSILTLITGCLIIALLAWIMIEIPQEAERFFGVGSSELTIPDKLELSARLLLQKEVLRAPAQPQGSPVPFKIEPGESAFSVSERLESAGLIHSAQALRDFLVYAGLDTSLQSGEYQIDPRKPAIEIAWDLQDSTPTEVAFHILAGWRLEEIAESVPTSGLEFSSQDFLSAVRQPKSSAGIMAEIPSGRSLEGFLFPDNYRFSRKISVESMIETILQNFDLKVDHEMRENYQNQGLSLFQAVTLASIVEREAVQDEEMPMIASVFLNRLTAGMKLDTDPTIQYALGYDRETRSWWKNPLSLEDLQVSSPYNTYQNLGLPPGPISNPGLTALRAVAYPAKTPYFYFRSACDGSGLHDFSETFEQHNQKACPE